MQYRPPMPQGMPMQQQMPMPPQSPIPLPAKPQAKAQKLAALLRKK